MNQNDHFADSKSRTWIYRNNQPIEQTHENDKKHHGFEYIHHIFESGMTHNSFVGRSGQISHQAEKQNLRHMMDDDIIQSYSRTNS